MRWRQRRALRLSQERELLLEQIQLLVRQEARQALLEALRPLAQALERQDSLLLQESHRLEWKAETAEEILLELLQVSQRTPASSLRHQLGLPS